jgi:hypothetical protein
MRGYGYFTNSPEGRNLSSNTVTQLELKPDQIQLVNDICHAAVQDFAQIQSNSVTHNRDSSGHVHVTINPATEAETNQIAKLRDHMWKELGVVLTTPQSNRVRNLPGDPFDNLLPRVNTGLTQHIEFWKDKNGLYHATTDMESEFMGQSLRSNTSTNINLLFFNLNIPQQYRSLLE